MIRILKNTALLLILMLGMSHIGCSDGVFPPTGLDINPGSADFGQVQIGGCKDTTISLYNNTSEPLTLRAVLNDSVFALRDTSGIDAPLQVGYDKTINASFCPKALGTFRDTLKLFEPDSLQPIASIPLLGEGI